jgi:hypothetical protein
LLALVANPQLLAHLQREALLIFVQLLLLEVLEVLHQLHLLVRRAEVIRVLAEALVVLVVAHFKVVEVVMDNYITTIQMPLEEVAAVEDILEVEVVEAAMIVEMELEILLAVEEDLDTLQSQYWVEILVHFRTLQIQIEEMLEVLEIIILEL